MKKKNLIILTSITGLLLTLTPSQALAQSMADSPKDFGPPDTSKILEEGKNTSDDNERRLASEDKCHWDNEVPVPENGFVKAIYDAAKELDADSYKSGILPELQKRVDNGELSEQEARYRSELIKEKRFRMLLSYDLSNILEDPSYLKYILNDIYKDDPDKAKELYDNVMKEYSFKALLEYIKEYDDIDYHATYASDELYDKYKKEVEELEKEKKRLEDNFIIANNSGGYGRVNTKDIEVKGPLEGYDSEEAQLKAYEEIYEKLNGRYQLGVSSDGGSWFSTFITKKEAENITHHHRLDFSRKPFSGIEKELNIIKDKNLNNDDFYSQIDEYVKNMKDSDKRYYISDIPILKENDIEIWKDPEADKHSSRYMEIFKTFIIATDLIIPDNVTCDEEEKPGEDEDTDTPTKPDTPEDKDTTAPTTKTTSKQDKPSTKTSTKSSDKSIITTTNNEDKEDTTTSEKSEESIIPNKVKTPEQVNTPNNPLTPNQVFTPVNNSKPGTFNGGVSSSVDGEELSDGSKVDTGSPTTSLLNKIRTIF